MRKNQRKKRTTTGNPASGADLSPSSNRVRTVDGMSNHQIVTLAVYLCGGHSSPIDTEDVAVKANDLSPGRFTWRKYVEQISLEHIRVALSDAKKGKNGALISGTGDEGWMLTPAGNTFAEKCSTASPGKTRRRLSNEEKRWIARERARLLTCDATAKASEGRLTDITQREAETFFRLDDYVLGEARRRKVSRLINLLGDDAELGEIILAVANRLDMEQS